jgi:hypothetical protein
MPVIPAVPYLLTGLAGCSVDSGISRGTRNLVRTTRVIKKKNFDLTHNYVMSMEYDAYKSLKILSIHHFNIFRQ